MRLADDPVLRRFRAALDELYGVQAERVVLFGSRARGDAREDSDYDIAVFINDPGTLSDELPPARPRQHGYSARHRRGDFG